jgi:hypothetical protein
MPVFPILTVDGIARVTRIGVDSGVFIARVTTSDHFLGLISIFLVCLGSVTTTLVVFLWKSACTESWRPRRIWARMVVDSVSGNKTKSPSLSWLPSIARRWVGTTIDEWVITSFRKPFYPAFCLYQMYAWRIQQLVVPCEFPSWLFRMFWFPFFLVQ